MKPTDPGMLIKTPRAAPVPTALCIGTLKALRIGTLKVPPPIPIRAEREPMHVAMRVVPGLDGRRSLIWKDLEPRIIFPDTIRAITAKMMVRAPLLIKPLEYVPTITPMSTPGINCDTRFLSMLR